MARLGLFSRLASVSAGTAACSELIPGLILLPRPPFPNTRPALAKGPAQGQEPCSGLRPALKSMVRSSTWEREGIDPPGGCWQKRLPKTSPQPPGFLLGLAVTLQPHRPGLSGAARGYRESWAGEGHRGHTAGTRSRPEEVCRRDSLGARSG